jgi:hypothetical protein
MNDRDKIGFMGAVNSMMALYNLPAMDINTVRIWYSKLEKYEFKDVCKAFDIYTTKYSTAPNPADIIRLMPEPVQFTQLPAPKLSKQENKEYSDKMLKAIEEAPKPTTDMKAWAKRIIKNPKDYPEISLRFAKEALESRNVRI